MRLSTFLSVCAALTAFSNGVAAEPLRIHGGLSGAKALGQHQSDEFGFGGGALAAVEYPILSELGLHLQLATLVLAQGDAPSNALLERLNTATAVSLSLGVRIYPLRRLDNEGVVSPAGLWLAGSFGGAQTGEYTRPALDAAVGFDFFVTRNFGIGPMLGYYHVFQPDAELRPADANIAFAGLHIVYDTRDYRPVKAPVDDDRDRDGIPNAKDKCPDVAEDKDDFQDEDGCPEFDNDKDGIVDTKDNCPLVPEDKDRFQDDDGCPDLDNDGDGIADKADKCPDVAEDKDDFEDEDGCPDLDNDKDGIPDKQDLCPNEPETKNGYADHDGCPDEEDVRVIGDKIVLDEKVYFQTNSAIIRDISYHLLERLAKLVKDHPEYIHVHIVGHADARGKAWYNKKLSASRARSVLEFLVERGIDRPRLSSEGFGAEKPLIDNNTERAYFMNRRVEFVVTRKVKQAVRTEGGASAADLLKGEGAKSPDSGAEQAKPQSESGAADAGEAKDVAAPEKSEKPSAKEDSKSEPAKKPVKPKSEAAPSAGKADPRKPAQKSGESK